MDKYITVRKPSSVLQGKRIESPPKQAFSPYPQRKLLTKLDEDKQRLHRISAPLCINGKTPSKAALTHHLLRTLSDESNPITHSNIYERSDVVVSAATGHQRGDGRGRCHIAEYFEDRNRKLAIQRKEVSNAGILQNVRVYIGGYLGGTTDIEMKRIIGLAGGTTLRTPSGATHILTSQQLSGSKTHKLLTTKSKNVPHVVRPEWVTDSIQAGKRLKESCYTVIRSSSTRDLVDILKAGRIHDCTEHTKCLL